MLHYNFRYQLVLLTSDIALVVGSLMLASCIRIVVELGSWGYEANFATPPILFVIAAIIWAVSFEQVGVYDIMKDSQVRISYQSIMRGHLLACLLFMGALYIGYRDYSRLQAFYFFGIMLIAVLLHRSLLRLLRDKMHARINEQRKILIVGAQANACRIGHVIEKYANQGLQVIGYLKTEPGEQVTQSMADKLLGTIGDLPELVRQHQIDEVLVAVEWYDQATADLVSRVICQSDQRAVNVRMVCDYSELAYFRVATEDFDGLTLISLREAILSPVQRLVKRTFDIFFSALVLVVTSPISLAAIIAIKMDTPGPAIFRQRRVGEHGREFTIYKFRTMYMNAESMTDVVSPGQKDRNDPRITRVGRWLRRTSIDELPQFINALRGELSVVGPRPELTSLVDRYEWWQRKRFEVPQGITGWWQVTGRSDKPLYSNTEDDLFYIRNYSLWLDIQIIFMTVISLITGRGAY